MFSAYFWLECISYLCSILTFIIACILLIITAIMLDRRKNAKRNLKAWLKEADCLKDKDIVIKMEYDDEQMEDSKGSTLRKGVDNK